MGKNSTPVGRETNDIPLRGSREAMLGTEGLRVSRAQGTTPARAPDDSRPPAYGGYEQEGDADDAQARCASREAALGGSSSGMRAAGGLAPEDERLPHGARPGDPDPERNWADDEAGSGGH